jgi:hypothetical protein
LFFSFNRHATSVPDVLLIPFVNYRRPLFDPAPAVFPQTQFANHNHNRTSVCGAN